MMNDSVKKILNEQTWFLATYSDTPNCVPVAFKEITSDGKLIVGDVFLDTTLANIQKNGMISVSACNAQTFEGYQIQGKAVHIENGELVDKYKKIVSDMFHGTCTAKGILIITPEKIIVTTPGKDNKREL
jgi:hypothetical protein